MKRLLCKILGIWLSLTLLPNSEVRAVDATDALELSAKYAVLLDADTGQVLYAKDCDTPAPMASTTKIMTALLLLEAGEPEATLTATDEMVRVEGTSMGLLPGDLVSRHALAVGMLLASGNDAAGATALHLAPSRSEFAALMNQRAAKLGMTRSFFVTPSGLDAEGHAASAYDMALLGAAAIRNPAFRAICEQSQMSVRFGAPPSARLLKNHNRLLRAIPGCIGLKTGFTKKAGRCLVSAVERDGRLLVAVTLHAPDDWRDHQKLYDYGFQQYHPIALDDATQPLLRLPIAGGDAKTVPVVLYQRPTARVRVLPHHIRREILIRPFEYAPLPAAKVLGVARYFAGDLLLTEVPLITDRAVAMARPEQAKVQRKSGKKSK